MKVTSARSSVRAAAAAAREERAQGGRLVDRAGERERAVYLGDGQPVAGLDGDAHAGRARSTKTLYDETAVRSLGG